MSDTDMFALTGLKDYEREYLAYLRGKRGRSKHWEIQQEGYT